MIGRVLTALLSLAAPSLPLVGLEQRIAASGALCGSSELERYTLEEGRTVLLTPRGLDADQTRAACEASGGAIVTYSDPTDGTEWTECAEDLDQAEEDCTDVGGTWSGPAACELYDHSDDVDPCTDPDGACMEGDQDCPECPAQ